jgi:hypothetical protein
MPQPHTSSLGPRPSLRPLALLVGMLAAVWLATFVLIVVELV